MSIYYCACTGDAAAVIFAKTESLSVCDAWVAAGAEADVDEGAVAPDWAPDCC